MNKKSSGDPKKTKEPLYAVYGTVTGSGGKAVSNANVIVWRQLIRDRLPLAEGRTSKTGLYQLKFDLPKDAPGQMLIVVEAHSRHLSAPLTSPLTTAQPSLQINLSTEPVDQSEFTKLMLTIRPLLDRLPLLDVVEDAQHQDISFLAQETGQSTEQIMRAVIAARLEASYAVPAAAFYAFLRQNVPSALPSPLLAASDDFSLIGPLVQNIGSLIFALSANGQQSTLTAAIALDLIGPQFTTQVPQLVSQLQALHTTDLLSQPYVFGNATLAQLLDVAALPQAKQQTFAQALATNTQSMSAFWSTLGDGQHGFTAAEASSIQLTLSIGSFVQNFVPLVTALVQGFTSGTYKTLSDLARLSLQDWVQLVNQTGTPAGTPAAGTATGSVAATSAPAGPAAATPPGSATAATTSVAQAFATSVYTLVTGAYPTVALSSRIATGTFLPQVQQQPLTQFFQNNPSLELVTNNIPAYLATQRETAFAGILQENQAAVIANLRSIQRVMRVAPNPDTAQTLLSLGIKSATEIATMGQQQFLNKATKAGLSQTAALQTFHVAAQKYATVVSTYMQFNNDSFGIAPAMGTPSNLNATIQQAVEQDPSLATLFGSQDYCATDDCTSILSPAAYLCDLLLWLRNHPQSGGTALDVLDSRRPDIRHLLLNCPNSDTELPYIDLVNELLADKISPPIDSIATSYTQSALINGETYYYVVTAVNSLGESVASSTVGPITPSAIVPSQPVNVSAMPGDTQVTLGWDAVPGATSYNIYWLATATILLTPTTGAKITGATNPYIQTSLTNGTPYFYIVTAVNSAGEGLASWGAMAEPNLPTVIPSAPMGVSAMPGDAEVTISWPPVAWATSYNLYWSTTPNITPNTGTKIPSVANPFIQGPLINGIPYYFIVTAVNSLGESAASSPVVSVTPILPTGAPSTPFFVATPSDAEVTIGWIAVPGATSYNIYWSTTPNITPNSGTNPGTQITGAWNPRWKQTSADKTAEDLRAAPEYFNQGAYVTLFGASYPFTLPYSAGLDELRTYLRQWNLPLWQVRQALLPPSGATVPATVPQQAAVAAERFGMAPHGEDLIANANFVSASVAWNDPNKLTILSPLVSVPAFLQAAAITYEQLLELLEVSWVQGPLGIILIGLNDTCDTTGMGLSPAPLDPGFLDRAHRFLRLWLATGYKMWELDLLLNASVVGNTTLDPNALVALLSFRQLQDATGLAVDQLLAFYQDIDTASHRDPDGSTTISLYARIFLSKAVTSVAPDPDLAVVAAGGTPAKLSLSDHEASIQAALGVSAADLATLFGLTAFSPNPNPNLLTLDNLSLIYRVNALAIASKFAISDLITVASLLNPGNNPVLALATLLASPAATLAFLSQAKSTQQSGLTLDAITYLLTPPAATTLVSKISNATQGVITVVSNVGFPAPNFYITITGSTEILLVTGVSLNPDTTWNWTVVRGQQGTIAAAAASGAPVLLIGGWATTTQMTPADVATALNDVQQAVLNLVSPSTTLQKQMLSSDTTIYVASDAGFPGPGFYIYIGPELLLVTGVGGTTNATWNVARGQNSTPVAAVVPQGAAVMPTAGDAVINAVATTAYHSTTGSALAPDVTAVILQNVNLPFTAQSLLAVLMDPSLLTATGTITIGGSPTAGDTLQAILSYGGGTPITVPYTLTTNDSSVGQAAQSFADAIYNSTAGTGAQAFLAPCQVSAGVITLIPLNPGAAGINITSVNTATPVVLGHVAVAGSPSGLTGTITISGSPTAGDTLLAVLTDSFGNTATISYTVTSADSNSITPTPIDQTVSDFLAAINSSPAVAGPNPFLQKCTSAGAVITVTPLLPTVASVNTATPATGDVSVTPGTPAAAAGTIVIGGTPTAGDIITTVLSNAEGNAVNVSYTVTAADSSDPNPSVNCGLTAVSFANAINTALALVGPNPFLTCIASGADVLLAAVGANITCAVSTVVGHVSVSPPTTTTIGQVAFPNQFLAIQLFDKVAVLVRALKLSATELTWLVSSTNAVLYGGLDFTQLPVEPSGQSTPPLSNLLTTLLLIKLARLWAPSGSAPSLYDIIGEVGATGIFTTEAAAQAALATITGWPQADISAFLGIGGNGPLNPIFPTSYQAPATYDALRNLEAMASAAGASGSQIVAWGAVPPDEPTAQGIADGALGVLKSQQPNNDAWLALLPTFTNPLRENRSAALQAYLLGLRDNSGNPIYADVNTLFDYFLIDTQMSSCQVTSRVVQAYIAVQIFVERCRMNMEAPAVVVDLTLDDTWNQWEWMSRYRIWEANREVFCYPENWLLEAERPSRTEIFQTFEQEVRQGQSTADYLETVVLNYIERLDGLAHLLVTGTCQDPVNGNIYVVARTLADPPVFYMRSYVNGAWTGWAQIPLSITAQQVVPALFRGRVCLFWLDITISNEPKQTSSTNVDRYVTLSVYFSIFRNGSWAPAQASKGKLFDKPYLDPTQASDIKTVEALYTLKVLTAGHVTVTFDTNIAPGTITIGGSPIAGDTIQIVFDSFAHNAQSYVTVSYTLVSTDTNSISQTASNLALAIDNSGLGLRTSQVSGADIKLSPGIIKTILLAATVTPGAATAPMAAYAASLWLDVFRLGDYSVDQTGPIPWTANSWGEFQAVHIGRAVFDGRFSDLELNNLNIVVNNTPYGLLSYTQSTYGSDAQPLLPLISPDADLVGEPSSLTPPTLVPKSGALVTLPADPSGNTPTLTLSFDPATGEYDAGPILNATPVPFRVVGPDSNLAFDPTSYFFFQDNRRCYWVEGKTNPVYFPTTPADRSRAGFGYELLYDFHPFYHPFTRLFWSQLAGGGFDLLYDPNLQQAPDSIDPSYSDVFSFNSGYQPTPLKVSWDLADASTSLASAISASQTTIAVTDNIWIPSSPGFPVTIGTEILQVTGVSPTNNTTWTVVRGSSPASAAAGAPVTPTSQDRQFLDFSYGASYSVYNWELFYHIPLYIAQLLSQNQQFEDAQTWFEYIFNPTRQGSDPVPQRFWIPKPLHNLTSGQIAQQQINNLLLAVNAGNPGANKEVKNWRNNAFNPFLLADLRLGVPYMKSTVMSYLDNLIAWGDNLFASESREALSEATLLYVIASEILGPTPAAVTPPQHADESFDQLEPSLDTFANAMVEIENVIGGSSAGSTGNTSGAGIPGPQSFYFKIPSNAKMLGYWTTVADRLYKLRHCQNIAGAPLQLALFDAPIDPGLLIAAQAAGVDLSSVLSNLGAPLPIYRFTALYPQALDFVNAVRAYGSSLQAALEKSDAGALALLQQTTQQQLLNDGTQILDWQVQQAQCNIDNLTQGVTLAKQKYDFNTSQPYMNDSENTASNLIKTERDYEALQATAFGIAALDSCLPSWGSGTAGLGPYFVAAFGGPDLSSTQKCGAAVAKALGNAIDNMVKLATSKGQYDRRQDNWNEAAKEAQIQIDQASDQLTAAGFALQIAQQNQTLHQEQIDDLQKQIDFLNNKFTSDSLYNWMVGSLSATYFQSYQLAYQMCQQVERCYQFELGIQNSSFIQFGYWDSLYKGLLAGETLNHDLRRMQASYLQQNARRYELSRYVSLGLLDPVALQNLLVNGICDFTLPESLFDNDYPGHYNRRLTRMSVTVVYPNPGKFDNVKATLTLVSNKVRISTDTTGGYAEQPASSDPRFIYSYAANSQKIALGNAQDDPGLFITAIGSNIADQRYLPFENAGAISSWHLEMPQVNNEVDLSTVGDVVLHLYYTALDGGGLQTAVVANNAANQPTSGVKVFSAVNDFAAGSPTVDNPYPVSPWSAFLSKQTSLLNAEAMQTDGTPRWQVFKPAGNVSVSPAATVKSATAITVIIGGSPTAGDTLQTTLTPASGTAVTVSYLLTPTDSGSVNQTALDFAQAITLAANALVTCTVLGPAITITPQPSISIASANSVTPASVPQLLALKISTSQFPAWTRGKTITVTAITLLTVSPMPGGFVLAPQAPLVANSTCNPMTPVAAAAPPYVCSAIFPGLSITLPPYPGKPLGQPLGLSFELQQTIATDSQSLTKGQISDVLLLVSFNAT